VGTDTLLRTENFTGLNVGRETIMNFYQHEGPIESGWFRVRAVDFWDRRGPYSVPTKYDGPI
jgi:hypothetical protein